MKAKLYREYQGQGCGKPHGHMWCVLKDGEKHVTNLKTDAETPASHKDALEEATKLLGIPATEIEVTY